MSKYDRTIVCKKSGKAIVVDVYDVLKAFDVKCPAIAHAVKKLLAGGTRGYKDTEQDYIEAINSINRGIDLYKQGAGELG